MTRGEVLGLVCTLLSLLALIFWLAHQSGVSTREAAKQCQERGGVLVQLKSGDRCFAKEAFK